MLWQFLRVSLEGLGDGEQDGGCEALQVHIMKTFWLSKMDTFCGVYLFAFFHREMWEQSMDGMMQSLIMKTTNPPVYTYIAEKTGNQLIHKVN